MSYLDRLLPGLVLTSPDGDIFNAHWAGDERTANKQLGIFNYPKVDKPSIQDLGISGVEYPLTISFSGPDNDLVSTAFFNALSQRGKWKIDHPSKGVLFLQPVSFVEAVQPIKSGDLTVFSTNWLDVAVEDETVSTARISSLVRAQNNVVETSSLSQLVDGADQTSIENTLAIKSAVEKNLAVYDDTVQVLADSDADVSAKSKSIIRNIRSVIATTPVDLTALGGQIQALMSAPVSISGITLQSLTVYKDFIDKVISAPIDAATRTNLNIVLINELFMSSGVGAVNVISSNSKPQTRNEAISNMEFVSDLFVTVTDALDDVQEIFINQFVKDQYYSQSNSFVDSAILSTQTISYLLLVSFDLKTEKRFLLKEDTPPIIVCVNEYQTLGENDSQFDFFIETNNLKADEILLLPAGFEVVVYV